MAASRLLTRAHRLITAMINNTAFRYQRHSRSPTWQIRRVHRLGEVSPPIAVLRSMSTQREAGMETVSSEKPTMTWSVSIIAHQTGEYLRRDKLEEGREPDPPLFLVGVQGRCAHFSTCDLKNQRSLFLSHCNCITIKHSF